MKELTTCIFILYLCLCNLFCQNYIDYHRGISKAEHKMLAGSYNEAINIYDSIFRAYTFVFPRDCFIAAQIASYQHSDSVCYSFLKIGVENGLHKDAITANPHFTRLIHEPAIWQAFNNEYEKLRIDYNKKINWDLKLELVQMYLNDQIIRDKHENWFHLHIVQSKKLSKQWDDLLSKYLLKIKELTIKYGFPSYKITGVVNADINRDKFENTRISANEALIILYHSDWAFAQLKDILYDELVKGNISAREYALVRDFQTRAYIFGNMKDPKYSDYEYYILWTINKKKYKNAKIIEARNKFIEENIDKINSNRYSIGLGSFEDQRKKKTMQNQFNQYYSGNSNMEIKPYFDLFYYDL